MVKDIKCVYVRVNVIDASVNHPTFCAIQCVTEACLHYYYSILCQLSLIVFTKLSRIQPSRNICTYWRCDENSLCIPQPDNRQRDNLFVLLSSMKIFSAKKKPLRVEWCSRDFSTGNGEGHKYKPEIAR